MMENGFAYTDIVLLALIAGFVLLRLRNVLGQNTGFDGTPGMKAEEKDVAGTIIQMPRQLKPPATADDEARAEEERLTVGLNASVKVGLDDIRAADPSFRLAEFLEGAKGAFDMTLQAFKNSDKQTLTLLLAKPLAEEFITEAEKREKSDQKIDTTLVSIESAKPILAEIDKKKARIGLKIVSEQITVIRDADGKIIEGDPSHVERVEDEWIFERDIASRNPNWTIVDT